MKTNRNPNFVPASLFIDDFFGPFVGEVDTTTRWNGWACPRFTREVAEQIAVAMVADSDSSYPSWRWDGDKLILSDAPDPDYPNDNYDDVYEADSDGMYHVGSWAWTWDDGNDD